MDCEKIIVELLSRIQSLEEKVAVLMAQQENKKELLPTEKGAFFE